MSQKPLNLRRSWELVKRYRMLVAGAALAGMVAGVGYAVVNPPVRSSQALVVIPAPKPNITTHVLIADSTPVLSKALSAIGSGMTLDELRTQISVSNVTPSVISFTATGKTAAQAESEANAVAASYVSYVGSTSSPVGPIAAHILTPASTATSAALVKQLAIYGFLGLLAGALIGFIVGVQRNRSDRRLRQRDEIARSIGLPVVGSVTTSAVADATGWADLLAKYKPEAVQAWSLRTVLARLLGGGNYPENRSVVTVVSLAADREALAVGPQLAVFAASLGIRTALIICTQRETDAVASFATLRAAAAAWSPASQQQSANLRVIVAGDPDPAQLPDAPLTVLVAIVDGDAPKAPAVVQRGTALLGVSAGNATAEQLARAASAVADANGTVAGILVANPETGDATTGHAANLGRQARGLPTRVNGAAPRVPSGGAANEMREARR
jgi:capsular polysaccharide biosynthesis protein